MVAASEAGAIPAPGAKLKPKIMTIEKRNGLIIISDVVKNRLVTKKYLWYSKKAATREFKQYLKTL